MSRSVRRRNVGDADNRNMKLANSLAVTDVFDASSVDDSSAMIAELSWRDSWSWED